MEKKQSHRGRPTTAATPGKKSTLGIRVTAELKTRLDKAAKDHDRPLSQEAEIRLERSFSEERGWGGPTIQNMARRMASTFALAGNRSNPDLPPEQWINDPYCYRAAVVAVVLDLVMSAPNADDPENIALMFEDVKGRVLSRLINTGKIENPFTFDDKGQDNG